ncbi:ATP-grasp fold amidoligase family protein [uncultured Brachyspira sp.]|uniref:ATP-grasp fold amidoligase family protein n=1 Tax=uncultured Brachyspira sp. TaxID=221953 RepID=UPI00262DFAA8|nr:ATP-grasp fold amidoligase family protein [uncultured Brachyspira sp.]
MTKEENLKFKEDIIKKKFKESLGYELNLENPKTFNEKLQWLKLYYNDPLMTKCADKYLVREYVKEIIGEEYLIPLLGVWDNPDDIDFDSLPNKFVLKVNWGWSQNIIVKDKTKINVDKIKEKLRYWMESFSNHYYVDFEWQYKNIKPKIICEKYIKTHLGISYEYSVLCFNGIPYYIYAYMNGLSSHDDGHMYIVYDTNWNKQPLLIEEHFIYDEKDSISVEKPDNLDLLLELTRKLCYNFYLVRVDFYNIDSKLYVGELTLTPASGFTKTTTIEYGYKLGELLELPKEKKIEYDYIDVSTAVEQLCDLERTAITYKKYEENFRLYKNKYERLKSKSFALFGFFDEEEYFTLIIFGIKIALKKKSKLYNL